MKKMILRIVGYLIVICFLGIAIWGVYRRNQNLNIFSADTYVLNGDQAPPTDKVSERVLQDLVRDRKLLSVNQVYTWTLDYYDRIFSTLIALIGVLGAISYFYIRTASGEEAKEEIQKEVQNCVKNHLDSYDYRERLFGTFAEPEIDELKRGMSALQEGLEFIKQSKAFNLKMKLGQKMPKKRKTLRRNRNRTRN